jgi:hypothetical protein
MMVDGFLQGVFKVWPSGCARISAVRLDAKKIGGTVYEQERFQQPGAAANGFVPSLWLAIGRWRGFD